MTASFGTIVRNSNGTWNWSFSPTTRLDNVVVTVSASDGINTSSTMFTVSALVNVVSSGFYYKGSVFAGSGVAAAVPTNKSPARAGASALTLSYSNLVNTTRGINGLVFNAAGLTATSLAESDFTFRMSPQGVFNEAANPPATWASAPAPSSILVTAGSGATPAQVRMEWVDGVIANRWLQLRILANGNTGLPNVETYYLGHLLGELNGQVLAGAYFVNNADLVLLNPIGGVANVNNVRDVDKNGFVFELGWSGCAERVGGNFGVAQHHDPGCRESPGIGAARRIVGQ